MTVLTPSAKDLQAPRARFDVEAIRANFPILSREVNGKRLVYLDNGASAQKPRVVLDAIQRAYGHEYANVHRGLHYLSNLATAHFEQARETVRRFVNARSDEEIIFTRNATEAINLVASSYGAPHIGEGDEILLTIMEHHSNIVPWHFLRERQGAVLKWAPVSENGDFLLDAFERLISPRTKIIALTHMSNVLGTIVPLKEVVRIAHERGIPVLADGAQGAVHLPVDVQDLDVDFYAFTGHKLYGPTGIGVLHGREAVLDAMPPFLGGGDMIRTVTFQGSTWNELPYKFEAGTPNIAGAVGLGAAIDYVRAIGFEALEPHESALVARATDELVKVPGVRIVGTARRKASVVSFVMDDIHPHDIGTIVDREGIAIRTGHHCAQPVMDRFGIPATARASFAMYNTMDEVDALVAALGRVRALLG